MPDAIVDRPIFVRALDAQPRTLDAEQRTVEVIFSTGAGVVRRDWEGQFLEVLSLEPDAVDLSRAEGMPVLNAHKAFDLNSVLGAVRGATVDAKGARATIVFSRRPDVDPFFRDVADGILRNVSVGYSVEKWADSTDPQTGQRTRTVLRWTPLEISFVPIAADSGATVRSQKETLMPEVAVNQPATPPAAPANRVQINAEIRSLATIAGLDDTFANDQIDRQATVEQARAAAFEAMQQRSGGPIRTATISAGFLMVNRLTLTGSTLRPQSIESKGRMARGLKEKVWPLLEAGKIKPIIYKTFPLRDAAGAHAELERADHVGKVMMTV